MTARAQYRETTCKTALNRVHNMPFQWSLNPYRGCVHGCHYCFARRYHAYFDLNAGDDFTGIVFVKTNIAEVLRAELWHPRWRREVVALGTATDPYQPIEGKYRLTRRCLEALADRRSPVSLVTKGPMVIRDVDVLSDLSHVGCTVCISITTLDADLARRLEPTTAPPAQRLRAVERLAGAGVRTGVLMAPVVPGITDDPACMDALARAAAAHGASFLGGRALYLMDGTKEHFMQFLEEEFPALVPEYRGLYRQPTLSPRVQTAVDSRIAWVRRAHGLGERDFPEAPPRPTQLRMAV